MTLNPDLIRARCAEIDASLSRLEALRPLSRETFLSNQDTLDVACYRLLIAIEAALAICFHVSAKQLHRIPDEYAGCFSSIEQAGLIAPDLSTRLQPDGTIPQSIGPCVLENRLRTDLRYHRYAA
ncbi:MAG: DUF86 domain-containing protein [Nitrospira sp.]|nr:DUF86 domain-containing protein [Nitrospira sp.]